MTKLKQSIADNGGFKRWFVNVFWFHYKWAVIALVVVLTVLIYLTVDAIRTPKYDAKVAVIAVRNITQEQLESVDAVLSEALGDQNGDGQVNILFRTANLNENEEYAEQYREVFYTCLGDEDYVLYLMDEATSAVYSSEAMGYFDPLEQYGIQADGDNPCRRSLSDVEVLQACKADDLYLCILDHGQGSDDAAVQARSQHALDMAKALLEH